MDRQGIFLFDEPESALSPSRQIDFLRLLKKAEESKQGQIIMITHSPLLMAFPGADVISFSCRGIEHIELEQVNHFQLLENFSRNPQKFIKEALILEDDE